MGDSRKLNLTGNSGSYASSTVNPGITSDFAVRVHANPDGFGGYRLIGNSDINDGFQLLMNASGVLTLQWRESNALRSASSTVAVGSDGELHYEASLDVDNGAGGYDVTFQTSTDGTSWSGLGSVITGGAPTSVDAKSGLYVGANNFGTSSLFPGDIFSAQVFNDTAASSLVASFDPDDAASSAVTSFVSAATGETWVLNGDASLIDIGGSDNTSANHLLHAHVLGVV